MLKFRFRSGFRKHFAKFALIILSVILCNLFILLFKVVIISKHFSNVNINSSVPEQLLKLRMKYLTEVSIEVTFISTLFKFIYNLAFDFFYSSLRIFKFDVRLVLENVCCKRCRVFEIFPQSRAGSSGFHIKREVLVK